MGTAAACPNYPYCDATGGFLPVPDVPGAGEVSQLRRRSSDPTRESGFLLCQASRLTPLLRQQFSSSPVLVSPLTLLLSTPSSLARAGFRKDLTPVMLLITSLSRRSLPSRDNLLRIIMVVVKIHIYIKKKKKKKKKKKRKEKKRKEKKRKEK